MTTVLKLDEIKRLIDVPQLIREIETGFVQIAKMVNQVLR